jgi:hypothetical protein
VRKYLMFPECRKNLHGLGLAGDAIGCLSCKVKLYESYYLLIADKHLDG